MIEPGNFASRVLRLLVRRPASSFAVVALLALALGASAAVFSVLDAVVLSPLDLEDPERLVWVWSQHRDRASLLEKSSEANVVDWRQSPGVFEALVAARNRAVTWSGLEAPQKLSVVITTSDYFEVLGARPLIGRTFQPGDEQGSVVLLSQNFWQNELGSRPDILGETLILDQKPFEVIGVMPAAFSLPRDSADIFLTQRLIPEARRTLRNIWVLGRLAEGTTLAMAQQHMTRLSVELAEAHPRANQGWGAAVQPLDDHLIENVRPALWTLFGAVVLVLLIATSNAAYLLLLSASERRQELAIRRALGASRWQMTGGLVFEALLLSLLGGLGGLLCARLMLPWLLTRVPESLPRQAEIGVDLRVLLFGSAVAVLSGVLCGLASSFFAGRNLAHPLQSGARAGSARGVRRLRVLLVVGELTLAMVLLTSAGLMARSFTELSRIDPGFAVEDRAVIRIFTQPGALEAAEKEIFFRGLEEHLAAVPGVLEVGGSTALPLSHIGLPLTTSWRAPQQADSTMEDQEADLRLATPGFLPTLGVPLISGRLIEKTDQRDGQRVAVINETLAAEAFAGVDPVGLSIELGADGGSPRTIVGVVGNIHHDSLLTAPRPEVYLPISQHNRFAGLTFVLHTEGPPESMLDSLRRAVIRYDAQQPPHSLTTLAEVFEQATAKERFAAESLAIFALFAVLLASFGLYAILTAAVMRRRREIGIRRALGARPRSIRHLVIGEALRWSLLGIAFGCMLAQLTGRWLSALLVGVSANDATTLAAAAGLLLAISLLAAWLPTRGALRIEATEALRDS